PEWQLEVAYAQNNLGIVQLDKGRPREARAAFQHARGVLEAQLPQRADLAGELGSTLGWLSDAEEKLGDLAGAIEARQAQARVHLQRPDAAHDRRVQQSVATATSEIARLELNRGHIADARQQAQRAVEMFAALSATDTANQRWTDELAWRSEER